ncbi:MAG: folylpolyglutamate synthase/dihydrofolate synthase family protein [Actinomycetota bacterium]
MIFLEAIRELDARQPERMIPDLSRIEALADLLDHPERTYPSVHITGTNGKTTTARLVTAITCTHGLPTGTYTSPHLESVVERISLCGDPIGEDEFAAEYERLLPYLREVDRQGEPVTYFETLTALAFLWFADKPVSLGVFEVGMGGLWDATSLVSGDVAVLCPISLDHPELGSTIAEVATEKAAIVKEGKVAVCREQPDEALTIVEDRCAKVGARLLLEERDFWLEARRPAVGGQVVSVRGLHRSYPDLPLQLFGDHAARNATAAVVAAEVMLNHELSEDALREGLSAAASPGRLEVVGRHPLVVLDGAHNPAGARALATSVPESFVWDRLFLILGCSANKDVAGIVEPLATLPVLERVFVAPHSSPRSANVEDVAAVTRAASLSTEVFDSVPEAVAAALGEARDTDLILVTGSLYTVADARRAFSVEGNLRDGHG